MMNDSLLRLLDGHDGEKLVGEALRLLREGDLLTLAESPLAQCDLVGSWYVGNEPNGSDERGRATQDMLQWLIERLKPNGTQHWTALRWRPYNVLSAFYLEGRRIAEIAELLSVAEQTVYPIRSQAIMALTKILREELSRPSGHRPNYALESLYPTLPAGQQTLLRALALLPQPVDATLLHELASAASLRNIEPDVQTLTASAMLVTDHAHTTYTVQPKLRPFLLALITPSEREIWHSVAATHAQQHHHYLAAAQHWRLAGQYDTAAHGLITHHQHIIDELHGGALRDLLGEFRAAEISDARVWTCLKLVSGDVALTMNDVATALREYQQALNADDVLLKAEAYYRRGKAFRSQNTAEAQAHFAYALGLLEVAAPSTPLLPKIYLDQAWMLFEDRQDWVQAEASLRRAEVLIDPQNRAMWAELANTWGMFYTHQSRYDQAIVHHQAAWLAANEMQDSTLQTHIAHNLGDSYVNLRQYDQAMAYFQQSAYIAQQIGNRRMEGLCHKSIGACYFWLHDYALAIEHYHTARAIFAAMHNRNWQANTCFDLAEAYAEINDVAYMQHYFAEAVLLAREAGLDRLLRDLATLARTYAGLYPPTADLNERQQQAYDHLKQHSTITNRDYRDLTAVSPKQAARDLNELLAAGIIVREGEGRSTAYRLADGAQAEQQE